MNQSPQSPVNVINQRQWQVAPVDILFMIACHTTAPALYHFDILSIIIKLSGVCRHWRSIFMSFPSFWAKIVIPCPNELLRTQLDRSADHPLHIDFNINCEFLDLRAIADSCSYISSNVSRIRTIAINIPPQDSYDPEYFGCIISLLRNPAPMLEHFHIHAWRGLELPKWFLEDTALTPNLKNLYIQSLSISYQMPIFKRVTRLYLIDIEGLIQPTQNLFTVLEATSDNLEALMLFLYRRPQGLDFRADRRIIQFNRLRSLNLDLLPDVLMDVLDHITTPSDVEWSMGFDPLPTDSLSISPLLSFLKEMQKGKYFFVDWKSEGNGFAQLHIRFAQDSSGGWNKSLRVCLHGQEPHIVRQIKSIFSNLCLSRVYSCTISVSGFNSTEIIEAYDVELLGSLLLPCHNLQRLAINCKSSGDFRQFTKQLRPLPASNIPCPLLNRLEIDLNNDIDTDSTMELAQILTDRKRAGHVLKGLYVYLQDDSREKMDVLDTVTFKNLAEKVVISTEP